MDHIQESFKNDKGMWSSYVSQHLLPRIYGFELLMAPYAVAHMKLGLQLKESGYDFQSSERIRIYLTNTLAFTERDPDIVRIISLRKAMKHEKEKYEHSVRN